MVTCVAGLVQAPTVSVTQNDVVPVTPEGVNGLDVPTSVANVGSEYQLMEPPLLVAVSGPTVEPAQ